MKTCFLLIGIAFWSCNCDIPSFPEIKNYFNKRLLTPSLTYLQKVSIISAMHDANLEIPLDKMKTDYMCHGIKSLNLSTFDSKTLFEIYSAHAYLKCDRISLDPQIINEIIKKSKSFESQYYLVLLKSALASSKDLKKVFEQAKIDDKLVKDTKNQVRKEYTECLAQSQQKQDFSSFVSKVFSADDEIISTDYHEILYLINAMISCHPNLLNNKQLSSSLNFVSNPLKPDIEIMDILARLFSHFKKTSILIPKITFSDKFTVVDSKNVLKIEILDLITGSYLDSAQTQKVSGATKLSSVECDGVSLNKNDFSLITESSIITLKFDSKYKKCSLIFDLENSNIIFKKQQISVSKPETVKFVDVSFSSATQNSEQLVNSQISFPDKISSVSKNSLNKILMSFYITSGNQRIAPKYVFLHFYYKNFMVSFPASIDRDRFTFDIDFEKNHKKFYDVSGTYQMKIVVQGRDFSTLEWDLGDASLVFARSSSFVDWEYHPKPITVNTRKVMFRSPLRIITLVFILAISVLVASLFAAWIYFGIGLEFRFGFWRLIFYASFIATFYILYIYWTHLDAFDAIKLYIPAMFLTCFSLNYLLNPKVKI